MRKPILVFRKQKSIAVILLSAAILLIGLLIIYENKNDVDAVAVFGEQNENSVQNTTIEDLLTKIME